MPKIATTNKFESDLEKCVKRHLDLNLLKEASKLLAKTGQLPPKYKPHPLKGEYKGSFEAHILYDWLLIWEYDLQTDEITLQRTGRHVDLFKKYR